MLFQKIRKRGLAAALAACLVASSLWGCDNASENKPTETGATQESSLSESQTETAEVPEEEPKVTYGQVAMGGGGFVTGLISTSESGLYYARTDVGGAYRYDKESRKWISLSYDVTETDRGLLGVDGLAVDPDEPNKVYMLCGTSYFSNGLSCIFISNDYGETFTRVDVTDLIRLHGNGMGRQNGERIAVDPNANDVILVGGRTGGMIQSVDGGQVWTKVNFPVTQTSNGNGICSIVFDRSSKTADGRTARIFAAVSEKGKANVYVSEDAGETWNPVDVLPTNYMPQRMKLRADGQLLITYSGAEGPWNGSGGAIYLYNPSTGEATDISPANKSFGDVVSDPTNPEKMVASTENVWSQQANGTYGDEFYVTTDNGKTWTNILGTMMMDANGVDWIAGCAIHWCGSLLMDPVETQKIMVVSGNGIFACDDIWAAAPRFYFCAQGVEETVPLEAVSIPGGPLVTAIGDYDGFVHEDIFTYPDRMTTAVGTNSSIAVAGSASNIWLRAGNDSSAQKLLYTEDNGKTWKNISNGPVAGKILYGGYVAVSADGSIFYWSPENGDGVYYTADRGKTWSMSENIPAKTYLVADPVNNNYVYGSGNGALFVSADGGATFERALSKLGNDIRCATVAGVAGTIYTAANMFGLQVSTDYGKTFTKLENVIWSSAVSTGKGLTEDCPALYIWGTVKTDEERGVFMSLDSGATWIRMNEVGVEFGGPGNGKFVVGDNNVVGRCYMSTVGLGLIYFQYNE